MLKFHFVCEMEKKPFRTTTPKHINDSCTQFRMMDSFNKEMNVRKITCSLLLKTVILHLKTGEKVEAYK